MNLSKSKKLIGSLMLMVTIVLGCGSTADILSTPIENIDTSPLKVTELTESEKKNWGHLDLERDTIPGMAVYRAYAEIIKNKKGQKVVVAVIDSGIDIDHEDLDNVYGRTRMKSLITEKMMTKTDISTIYMGGIF